jgi:Arc/MetJ-type ribon-helix-helix transcriptional regulator
MIALQGVGRHPAETEKITINPGVVELGRIDLLVRHGFSTNRTELIRTAIRNELARHEAAVDRAARRAGLALGLRHVARGELEALRVRGETLRIAVLGLPSIAPEVTPELARATIDSITVLGALHVSPAVKAALADLMR